MPTTIRKTKESDFPAITKLLEDPNIAGRATRKQFQRMLRKNEGLFFVAESDEKVIATIFGMHDGGYAGYIYKLAVAKDYRRKGIATLLLRKVIEQFKKAEIPVALALTGKTNKAAQKLLGSLGFSERRTAVLMVMDKRPV